MRTGIPLNTLSGFLEGSGARLQIFDMGRRVVAIAAKDFLAFEQTAIPYPYPLDQQAWVALLLQQQSGHLVWFLRLPLDEQGKLVLAARDDFMQRLLERLGDNLNAAQRSESLQTALQDNPYSFKPRDDRMAVFHARAAVLTGTGASKAYAHAQEYFSGNLGWDQWPFVGYQGIADIALRLGEANNTHMLVSAIPQLPLRPFEALCHCLENVEIDRDIGDALIARADGALRQPDPALLAAAIRGVALAADPALPQTLVTRVLTAPCSTEPDILAAIGGRAWESLAQPELAIAYLARLADNHAGQSFFDQCLSDLLFLPGMRQPLLGALRCSDRSQQLAQRIGAFFQSVRGKGAAT